MDDIWKFDMKEKNWKKCGIKMPFPISCGAAVVNESDSTIHVIGGYDSKYQRQSTHYMIKLVEHTSIY